MLRFLGVRHLAVIDRLEVEFEPGLNLLTGETGAGKSVLVEAIDLLLGGRASADLVRTGETQATVQAIFERPDGREIIVRRELSAQGRSRAFIDDALVTTAALRELGRTLVDLHGQHEHQTLLHPAEHLAHLDAFLGASALARDVAARFAAWQAAAGMLEGSRLDAREKAARIEMATFQLREIDEVAPLAGEDDDLASERVLLANAQRLSSLSADAYAALYEDEGSALATLGTVWKRLGDLAGLDPRFGVYLDQRDAVKSSLDELAYFLRSYAATLEAAPDRLQAVEDRLAALERLKRKYGPDLADVLSRRRALAEELSALTTSEERAAELADEERQAGKRYLDAAGDLSAARQAAGRDLARTLERALAEVAMPGSRVDVRFRHAETTNDWTAEGIDRVEFLLSPNPGEELRPLARIASGGELSRVMLALRGIAAGGEAGRTLVFDEVDAGIGGVAADAVGARLEALAERCQVICITHLPQIAARQAAHYQVAKQVRDGRTLTVLARLDRAGRELELTRMIAGSAISPEVLASARQMLGHPGESETKAKGESAAAARTKGRRRGA